LCTRNPMMLGRAINAVQRFWSADGQSKYSHAGIIIDADGATFEALWTNTRRNLFEDLAGVEVLIGRHRAMTSRRFDQAWKIIRQTEGRRYPGWRLVLHLLPAAPKYLNSGRFKVCSELVDSFYYHAGIYERLRPGLRFKGRNPGQIEDMIYYFKEWDVVFEGIIKQA